MSASTTVTCKLLHQNEEVQALTRIFKTAFTEQTSNTSTGTPSPRHTNPHHRCVIGAFVGDTLVGGLVAYELPLLSGATEMYLYDIAVLPQHRRLGIGTRLIEALMEEAKRRGVSTIFVEAEADDTGAIAFYRSLKAEEQGVCHFNIAVA
jgi:ribosomal protein S18 acetylase RimI-like enzyme